MKKPITINIGTILFLLSIVILIISTFSYYKAQKESKELKESLSETRSLESKQDSLIRVLQSELRMIQAKSRIESARVSDTLRKKGK